MRKNRFQWPLQTIKKYRETTLLLTGTPLFTKYFMDLFRVTAFQGWSFGWFCFSRFHWKIQYDCNCSHWNISHFLIFLIQIVYKKTGEWQIEWQQVTQGWNECCNQWKRATTSNTTSDPEWQRVMQGVTGSNSERYNGRERMKTDLIKLKRVILV